MAAADASAMPSTLTPSAGAAGASQQRRSVFRPCIDLHDGQVKQIVGGTLTDSSSGPTTNFVSTMGAGEYAAMQVLPLPAYSSIHRINSTCLSLPNVALLAVFGCRLHTHGHFFYSFFFVARSVFFFFFFFFCLAIRMHVHAHVWALGGRNVRHSTDGLVVDHVIILSQLSTSLLDGNVFSLTHPPTSTIHLATTSFLPGHSTPIPPTHSPIQLSIPHI
jgi:hypothetical protein